MVKDKKKEINVGLVIWILFMIIIMVMVLNIGQSFQHRADLIKHRLATVELVKTQIGFLTSCMEIGNTTIEEVQDHWIDKKFEEIKDGKYLRRLRMVNKKQKIFKLQKHRMEVENDFHK